MINNVIIGSIPISCTINYGGIAPMVERGFEAAGVGGSSPSATTLIGRCLGLSQRKKFLNEYYLSLNFAVYSQSCA